MPTTKTPVRSRGPRARRRSRLVAIVSDIHFDVEDPASWRAFRLWHADVRPAMTVILGDFLDFGMLSRYAQEADAPVRAIPQIARFVREANALVREAGRVLVIEGNHDERWRKCLAQHATALAGALGFSLHEQCLAHGLDVRVEWSREDAQVRGVAVGPFVLRHGHNQSGRFGAPRHLAANRITKSLGQSEVFGHHHKAQLFCQTAHGRTAIAIANPCLTRPHGYAPDADWQRGFTVLELDPRDPSLGTGYPLVMAPGGRFGWGGVFYDGAASLRAEGAARKARKARSGRSA